MDEEDIKVRRCEYADFMDIVEELAKILEKYDGKDRGIHLVSALSLLLTSTCIHFRVVKESMLDNISKEYDCIKRRLEKDNNA